MVYLSPLSVGVFSCLAADVPSCRLPMEWVRGNADVDSSHHDGTYHSASAAYFISGLGGTRKCIGKHFKQLLVPGL